MASIASLNSCFTMPLDILYSMIKANSITACVIISPFSSSFILSFGVVASSASRSLINLDNTFTYPASYADVGESYPKTMAALSIWYPKLFHNPSSALTINVSTVTLPVGLVNFFCDS